MTPRVVVADTMVVGWRLSDRPPAVAAAYDDLVGDAQVLVAFQSAMELRFGAVNAGWGELRMRRLDRQMSELVVVQPDHAMIVLCAELRSECRRAGHPLAAKDHVGDLWIASTALRLDVPLVSDDQVFVGTPRLQLVSAA